MRNNWRSNLGLIAVILTLVFSCTQGDKQSQVKETYTCPMHPTVISDKPGTCPVCGMELVRKARPGEELKLTEEIVRLTKSTNESVRSSIRTVKGEYKSLKVGVEAQGRVSYDTRSNHTISARIAGRLEKVYLRYALEPVHRGQKVAEIYSPELVAAQRELLFLTEHDAANTQMIEASKQKLFLLGATVSQVDHILATKEPLLLFSIYSPYDGYVVGADESSRSAAAVADKPSASMDAGGMPGKQDLPAPMALPPVKWIREGDYVARGQNLFNVVSQSSLRVEFDLPAEDGGLLKKNDELSMETGGVQAVMGRVDFIQPFQDNGEAFIRVRMYVRNQFLRVGQLVKARIELPSREALWVPSEAVVDLGTEERVFVLERGMFKPVKVITGLHREGLVEITSGLTSADEIASNALHLVDSESFIKMK